MLKSVNRESFDKKVLLLGGTGMAGIALSRELSHRGIAHVTVARTGADICCDLTDSVALEHLFSSGEFSAVVNAAALVDIDHCEMDSLLSWKLNSRLVSLLTHHCSNKNIPLMQISTDHYFDYGENRAHLETDQPKFLNEYARHKYAAECYALSYPEAIVIRTSILGTKKPRSVSLVDWAINNLRAGVAMTLFDDVWTSSIDVKSFAKSAWDIFWDHNYRGRVNIAASEVYSKAKLIKSLGEALNLNLNNCITGKAYLQTQRATHLGLDVSKAENVLGYGLPSLDEVIKKIVSDPEIVSH